MQKTRECLIIDDDPDDQEIFLMCMQHVNKDVVCRTVNDGVHAIALLSSDSSYVPGYIFIDMNMPKMNGIECLKQLTELKHLQDTKFYMYSTTSESSALTESKKLGAHDFIIKPSTTTELKKRLAKIF